MIRRILAGLFLIYLAIWLGAAYFIERKIIELADLGFECQKISMSGFPGRVKFKLSAPELTIQSQNEIQVFKAKELYVTLSPSLKVVKFEPVEKIFLETQSGGHSQAFQIELDPSTKLSLKFARSLIFASKDLPSSLSSIKFNSDNIYISSGDAELAFLEATDIYLKRLKRDSSNILDINFEINYAGSNEIFGFDSMRLSCEGEVEYNIDPISQKILLKKISLEDLELDINEDTYLGLFGSVALSKDDIPKGKFDLELQNYPELIDYIWPSSFDITAKEAQDIINEAAEGQNLQELSLPVVFSDEGLTINGKNLRDLKVGE